MERIQTKASSENNGVANSRNDIVRHGRKMTKSNKTYKTTTWWWWSWPAKPPKTPSNYVSSSVSNGTSKRSQAARNTKHQDERQATQRDAHRSVRQGKSRTRLFMANNLKLTLCVKIGDGRNIAFCFVFCCVFLSHHDHSLCGQFQWFCWWWSALPSSTHPTTAAQLEQRDGTTPPGPPSPL